MYNNSVLCDEVNKLLIIVVDILLFYYMLFAKSQILLWKFLYQNPCNMYANMHKKQLLLPALWLAAFNSTILSPQYSVLRSPHFDHTTNMSKECYFHPFIHIGESANVKSIKVHNFRKLRYNFHEVSTNRSPGIIQNTWQYMASLEIWHPLKLNVASLQTLIVTPYTLLWHHTPVWWCYCTCGALMRIC